MFDKKKETLMNSVTSGKSTMFSDNLFLKAAMMETSKLQVQKARNIITLNQ